MQTTTIIRSGEDSSLLPLQQRPLLCKTVFLNLSPDRLAELAVTRSEGVIAANGALMCDTGVFTGRSPKDRFIVRDSRTRDIIDWGAVNLPFEPDAFEGLRNRMCDFLADKQVFVRYAYAGADPRYRKSLMAVTTKAWHSLFCHNLFLRPDAAELAEFIPEWTLYCVPEFRADPVTDGTRQENFTIIDFTGKTILIGGTGYAGEIKKAMFSVLNFLLPVENGVLPMHCAANRGPKGDTALFFGLSGTGKTTLSADPERELIGDDEHGWSAEGIFNFEGGCYAKVVNLSLEREPQIFAAIRPGAILENTRFQPDSREIDYTNTTVTENTRAAYPLTHVPGAVLPPAGKAPTQIFFLTADAFGVLPPLSRLTPEQAMFFFLSGYTSKLAGTEMGIVEPTATFSSCFGAAFLPLSPETYTHMLGQRLSAGEAQVWLVNTGWTGGAYGTGRRIPLRYTRALLQAVLNDHLRSTAFVSHSVFEIDVPTSCPGVPPELLLPEQSWSDQAVYRRQAMKLLLAFRENAARFPGITGVLPPGVLPSGVSTQNPAEIL